MKWIKNFGVKTDVLTIYSLALGQKSTIKNVYGLPNCLDYKYVDGEEFRTQDYLEKLNDIAKRDIKKWTRLVVNRLNQTINNFEKFCSQKKRYKNNLDLFIDYWKFFKKYSHLLSICDIPILLDQAVSEKILEEIKNKIEVKKKSKIDEYFRILTVYLKDTHTTEEEKAMLKIAADFPQKIHQRVTNHQKKYSWMGFKLLLGKELNKEYFLRRIKEHSKTAKEELKEILSNQKNKRELFYKTIKKFNLDKELIECGQALMWIRDRRYVGLTRGPFYKRDLFNQIARQINLKTEDIFYLLPKEIEGILKNKKKVNKDIIRKRKKGFAILLIKGKISKPIIGIQLKKLKREKIRYRNIIKGSSANTGKVYGKVRVIFGVNDLSKFNEKEILVTNMTTPDYLFAMKKAAAIVTDIGGITSHAAIMSRELNKPCIIATQDATRVLKTGDLVEVDANKGIIKIL